MRKVDWITSLRSPRARRARPGALLLCTPLANGPGSVPSRRANPPLAAVATKAGIGEAESQADSAIIPAVRAVAVRGKARYMRDDHPVDRLVVAVAGEAPASLTTALRASARRLAGRRSWILGPPEFFDESGSRDGRSVGLVLSIYTARPPWGQDLDRQVDRDHLEEVKELIRDVCRISAEHHVSFVFDFAGESIGVVELGQPDNSLDVGLIGEWARILDESEG